MRLPMQKFREFSVALSTYLVAITNKRQRLLDIKSEISKPVNFKWDQNCRFLKSNQQPFDVMLDHQKQFDQIRIILLKTYLILHNQYIFQSDISNFDQTKQNIDCIDK